MSDLDADIADLELSVDLMDLEDLFGLGDGEVEVAAKPAKSCKHCGEDDLDKLYKKSKQGVNTISERICLKCKGIRNVKWRLNNKEKVRQHYLKFADKKKVERKLGKYTEKFILEDSRKSDRKKGLQNDLTLDLITQSISQGCKYCGETNLRMTLDRVDNSIGHLMSNVVPACIRCNYLRRDMPYKAWKILVPRIKEVLKKDLFGDWVCRARSVN